MISVLDIGLGNVGSIAKALKYIGVEYKICSVPEELIQAEKIIFPGVGNFSEASKILERTGLRVVLRNEVLINKVPFLGICLGMQLIATTSYEGGASKGLDLINARVERIPKLEGIKIPHIGWNSISHDQGGVFTEIPNNADFYFVHSYRMVLDENTVKRFNTEYGSEIVAYIEKDNIYGAQFHPEKSQQYGLTFLKNFVALC
jgi:glutamine amidotransferase